MTYAPSLTSKAREFRSNGLAMFWLVDRFIEGAKRIVVVGELMGTVGVQFEALLQSPFGTPPPVQIWVWACAGAADKARVTAQKTRGMIHRGRGGRMMIPRLARR